MPIYTYTSCCEPKQMFFLKACIFCHPFDCTCGSIVLCDVSTDALKLFIFYTVILSTTIISNMTTMLCIWHIVIFIVISKAAGIQQEGHVFYVLPRGTSNSSCPGNPCLDINTYIQDLLKYFVSNTTFIFLPGIHFLDIEGLFSIQDVNTMLLIGNSTSKQSSIADDSVLYKFTQYDDDSTVTYLESLANITCTGSSGLSFSNVTNLQLINLTITNCGVYSLQTSLNASIHLVNVTDLMIEGVVTKNSSGYGLLGVNVLGHSVIMRSSFIGNNQFVKNMFINETITDKCNNQQSKGTVYKSNVFSSCSLNGGNLYLQFKDPIIHPLESNELLLSQLVLSFGVDGSYPNCPSPIPGTGLALLIHQQSYDVHVTISNTVSYRNQGQYGANFYFEAISGSNITIYNVTSKYGVSSYGSMYYYAVHSKFIHHSTSVLRISNSTLECNYGELYGSLNVNISNGSVQYMYIYLEHSKIVDDTSSTTFLVVENGLQNMYISVLNSYFKDIKPIVGNDERLKIVGKGKAQLWVDNSYLMYTELFCESADVYISNSVFYIARATAIKSSVVLNGNVMFSNSKTSRDGGAMLLVSSSLVIQEFSIITFAGNSATYGGALFIDQSSSVNFISPSNVSFINNFASLSGGAIYFQSAIPSQYVRANCFFHINATIGSISDVHIYFEGNFAGEAGSALYGGNIDNCSLECSTMPYPYHDICITSSGKVFDMIMDIGPHDNSTSLISSDPTKVCRCNQSYPLNCTVHPYYEYVHVYPREKLSIALLALGQRDGIAPGIIYAWTNPTTIFSTLRTSNHCSMYDIPVFDELTFLTTQGSFSGETDRLPKIIIITTVLPCPFGLSEQNGSESACYCNELLQRHGFTCNISDQSISWSSGAKWIGNISHDVIGIIDDCPSDYCNNLTTVTLNRSDVHCQNSHSGILCGQCQGNLSMMFGSSRCSSGCSNYYLLLLIPFSIMGVALVGFLLLCNFTVTNGTINSFILYAFVIQLNKNIYFPSSCYAAMKFLSIFISWLNLDLGIETCFYQRMDSIGRVWLQFLFSVYVSLLIGAIILAGRISSRISRLCRYRIVPVIATLFLLIYSKMLRTLLIIYDFAHMDTSDASTTRFVWMYDGNEQFLGPKHIGLFIVGLLVIAFFIIPYTVLLLLTPYLMKVSHWRVFSWINRIKPLVDSYEAPFKDRYRFWTGAMLIYRIALVVMSAYFSQQPKMILLVVIIVHAGIVFSGFAI